MSYQHAIANMTPEVYERLKRAVELGRWPDGRPLTPEQRASCLEAVIAWGRLNLPEQERVGYIDRGHKAGDVCDDPEPQALTWRD